MTYVMCDIHGNLRRFRSVLEQIRFGPEDRLYILGDVIDRHGEGIHLLRRIKAAPNMTMLLGNHEFMMLEALGEPYDGPEAIAFQNPYMLLDRWYRNGGRVTHASWKHQRKAVREELIAWLKTLPLNLDVEVAGRKFRLVHGASVEWWPRFRKKGESAAHFAVWDREITPMCPSPGYTVLFGHTPTEYFQDCDPMEVWYGVDVIDLDCGCGYPDHKGENGARQGRLACLRLEDMAVFYSREDV